MGASPAWPRSWKPSSAMPEHHHPSPFCHFVLMVSCPSQRGLSRLRFLFAWSRCLPPWHGEKPMSLWMFRTGALCAFLVTVALFCGQEGNCKEAKGSASDRDHGGADSKAEKSQGGDLEKLIYARLSKDRCFSHPKFPYVLHVESVQGRK